MGLDSKHLFFVIFLSITIAFSWFAYQPEEVVIAGPYFPEIDYFLEELDEISKKNKIKIKYLPLSDVETHLIETIDPVAFQTKFGAGLEQLDELIAAKTVTINKLMEIAPAGTVDPTSSLYNTTMYLMAAILFVALVMNATMRPVDAKHHMKE